jgi:hypothetical protein
MLFQQKCVIAGHNNAKYFTEARRVLTWSAALTISLNMLLNSPPMFDVSLRHCGSLHYFTQKTRYFDVLLSLFYETDGGLIKTEFGTFGLRSGKSSAALPVGACPRRFPSSCLCTRKRNCGLLAAITHPGLVVEYQCNCPEQERFCHIYCGYMAHLLRRQIPQWILYNLQSHELRSEVMIRELPSKLPSNPIMAG